MSTNNSFYLNEAAHPSYVKSIKAFACLREALELSDKVVLGASTRLLDPYHETTAESRLRLLEQYPVHEFGLLKRIPLFSFTNIGYSEEEDREKMTTLRYVRYKPLEPHLHENNQAFSISADSNVAVGLVSSEPRDSHTQLYIDGTVSDAYRDLFRESQAAFDAEMTTYAVANNYITNTPHLMKELSAKGYVIYCPTIYLQSALHAEFLTHEEVLTFVNSQISLIASEIEKSLARKNKAERERTALFRDFLKAYAIFKSDYLPQITNE